MSVLTTIAADFENATPAQIESATKILAQTNFAGMWQAVMQGNLSGDLQTLDDVLAIIQPFVPEAAEARLAITVLVLIVRGYQTGAIKSAPVEDPSMTRVDGGHEGR